MRDFAAEIKKGLMGIELDAALESLAQTITAIKETERIPLEDSLGRIASHTTTAPLDLPPFDRSAMDGYALHHADIATASKDSPVVLALSDSVSAGQICGSGVTEGKTVKIMTGAPVPDGADTVIPFEKVQEEEDRIVVTAPVRRQGNICFRGEDLTAGAVLTYPGLRIDSRSIGALASSGLMDIDVYRRPRIALFTTGDEILPRGATLTPGKIYESNSVSVLFALKELGFDAEGHGVLPDDATAVAKRLEELSSHNDLIITTGAVSTGDKDIFHDALALTGARKIFWWVRAKPGSPVMVSQLGNAVVANLSGNPFAALVNIHLFVRPCLAALTGDASLIMKRTSAVMASPWTRKSAIRRFLRGHWSDGLVTIPEGHSPGMIANAGACNVLIDIPAGNEGLNIGDTVTVLLF